MEPSEREGEDKTLRICIEMEEKLFTCEYTLHTHQLLHTRCIRTNLRNCDVLTRLKFIASIYEVNNLKSSQPRAI